METRKWTTVAGPRQTKQVNDALGDLRMLRNTFKEITGIVGGEEHSSTLINIFGVGMPENESFTAAWNALGERFVWTITRDNYQEIITAAAEAKKTVEIPVVDKRETRETIAAREETFKAAEAKSSEEAAAWRAAHCLPENVKIPEGSMAITLSMNYDNSDSMSDYFDRHHGYGCDMLLAIVPKGKRTEALARSIVARYPTLAAFEWKWHVEEWSMGHGTYLESGYIGQDADITTYGGHKNPGLCYEIEFNQYAGGKEMPAWREYPGQAPAYAPAAEVVNGANGVQISENEEKDGVEIRFPSKPDMGILNQLKANGWRWSRFSSCWYAKRTPQAKEFAQSLIAG